MCHTGSHKKVGCVNAGKSMYHAVRVVRVVRCGRDLHLHGQVFVAPEGALASVAATSSQPLSTNGMKGADHETSCGLQVHGPHALSGEACWCHVISLPLEFRSRRAERKTFFTHCVICVPQYLAIEFVTHHGF